MRPIDCLKGNRPPFIRLAGNARTAPPLAKVVLLACAYFTMLLPGSRAQAQVDTGPSAQSPSIAIFLISRKDQCYDNGIAAAIEDSRTQV